MHIDVNAKEGKITRFLTLSTILYLFCVCALIYSSNNVKHLLIGIVSHPGK